MRLFVHVTNVLWAIAMNKKRTANQVVILRLGLQNHEKKITDFHKTYFDSKSSNNYEFAYKIPISTHKKAPVTQSGLS